MPIPTPAPNANGHGLPVQQIQQDLIQSNLGFL